MKLLQKASVHYWRNRVERTNQMLGELFGTEQKRILRSARGYAGAKARNEKREQAKLEAANQTNPDILENKMEQQMEEPQDINESIDELTDLFTTVMKDLTPSDVHVDIPFGNEPGAKKQKKKTPGNNAEVYAKSIEVPFMKRDDAKHIVYGVVLEPYVKDAQGDWETPEDIEKAAHGFMEMWREMGVEHVVKNEKIYPVESYIAPTELTWNYGDRQEVVKAGSWVLGSTIDDEDVWQGVIDGDFTGYSVEGVGMRVPADLPITKSSYEQDYEMREQIRSILQDIAKRDIPSSTRDKADESDFAGKHRSFPILKPEDVSAALHSIGRAGGDNYDSATLRSNILRIASRKGFGAPKE